VRSGSSNLLTPRRPARWRQSPTLRRRRPTDLASSTSWPGYLCRRPPDKIVGHRLEILSVGGCRQANPYYPGGYPASCFSQLGLFGLSAAEVPDPSQVPPEHIYQAFGIGGRFAAPNDGSALLGAPVLSPHYSALIASLRPQEAVEMWDWLLEHGHLSPLNGVESLMFPAGAPCGSDQAIWNQLKGSWNLSLQALGWVATWPNGAGKRQCCGKLRPRTRSAERISPTGTQRPSLDPDACPDFRECSFAISVADPVRRTHAFVL